MCALNGYILNINSLIKNSMADVDVFQTNLSCWPCWYVCFVYYYCCVNIKCSKYMENIYSPMNK